MATSAVMLALCAPQATAGGGGPMPPTQGGEGVSTPAGDVGYVAVGVGQRTVVQRVRRAGGAIERWRVLRGAFGIGLVAMDGSATGLSADGRTLVLASMQRRWPPRTTSLLVLDARRLRIVRRLALRGFYALDAISPDGRWLYLIRYVSPRTTLRYDVRAYDLRRERMIPGPIVDPREPDEAMQGTALTRATSPDGRWAFTLYLRDGRPPFVHALDTAGRTARCVDLPAEVGRADPTSMRLELSGGGTLRVTATTGDVLVDTRTFGVRRAPDVLAAGPPRATPPRRAGGDDNAGGTWLWAPSTLAGAALAGMLATQWRRRVRKRSPTPAGTGTSADR
jgi:hypothetical protein